MLGPLRLGFRAVGIKARALAPEVWALVFLWVQG